MNTLSHDAIIGEQYTTKAQATLAYHGKSFNWANQIFGRQMADEVAVLYAFCRMVDDIADTRSTGTARRELDMILADLDAGRSRRAPVSAFLDLAGHRNIDLRLARFLVAAVADDTGDVRLLRYQDVVRYAYGVASTVGLMMCAVMGVRNRAADPFAVDLGIAMQMTNISRDVIEDAHQGRIYIPAQWIGRDTRASDIVAADDQLRRRIQLAKERLLHHARIFYRSADKGMRFIPFRARLAVVTAARIYEAIGSRILKQKIGWQERAYVGKASKLGQTVGALATAFLKPAYWDIGPVFDHDPRLHQALVGLPGADVRASNHGL